VLFHGYTDSIADSLQKSSKIMHTTLNTNLAQNYTSASQKVRVLTENWVDHSVYCPNCGHLEIDQYPNNKPVADFYCTNCKEDYELKSKQNTIGTKIVDGAYRTMIDRLQSTQNPNFFLLNYNLTDYSIKNSVSGTFSCSEHHCIITPWAARHEPI